MESEFGGQDASSSYFRLSDWLRSLRTLARAFDQADKRRQEARAAFTVANERYHAAIDALQHHYRQLPAQRTLSDGAFFRINRMAIAWVRRRFMP